MEAKRMFKPQFQNKFIIWGWREVGREENVKKRNEGGGKTSYYSNIMSNIYDITAMVIKDVNCRDSILRCAIWFKTDSLLCSKQFTDKMKSFIYFDDLAPCCGRPLFPSSKVCKKERWNIKGCELGRKIIIIKKKGQDSKKKEEAFFQQDFFFFSQLQKMV